MGLRIPPRNPIGDVCEGVILNVDGKPLFAVTDQPKGEVRARGTFVLRYGIRYLGKPHLSIVPGLIALDYGDMLTGEDAWEFIFHRSNLYPRADVIGYRNDGADEMIPVKFLDLMDTIQLIVYADDTATQPLAQPVAVIAEPDQPLPERLRAHIPIFATIAAWQGHQHD